jgi:phosphoribosylformimino-5-aminoimidazole carboxamide ribonucleotide (ProFAR) isomerase
MTEKQTLIAHLREHHSSRRATSWQTSRTHKVVDGWRESKTLKELQRWHAREHHRYATSHYHEFDGEGDLVGPNTTERRPSGWRTGLGTIERNDRGR